MCLNAAYQPLQIISPSFDGHMAGWEYMEYMKALLSSMKQLSAVVKSQKLLENDLLQ